jgi:hypothetical protein
MLMKSATLRRVVAAAVGLSMTVGGLFVTVVANPAVANAASSVGGSITRAEALARAQDWVDQGYTYSQAGTAPDSSGKTYRKDCSGLVSMAWHLGSSYTTTTFPSSVITYLPSLNDLKPADAVLNSGHMELFAKWKSSSDHTLGAYVYSFNSLGQTVQNPYANNNVGNLGFDSWSELTTYSPIRYKNIVETSGTADVYGALADGRLTYSKIDVETGNRSNSLISTANLGFTPKAMATLNFNTVLVTTSGGILYRVDVGTNNTSLTFTKTSIGTGWTHDRLVYDGNSHLFGIAAGALRRYNLTAAKPTATSITANTLIDNGFTLKTLTSTAPDWIMGTDAAGELLSYHISGANSWTRYVLGSTWGAFTSLTSPGGGVYYGRAASGAMFRYLDANPTDGSGSDLKGFSSDPVDTSGWTQVVISARPNAI